MSLTEATSIRTKRGSRSLRCKQCPKWKCGFCHILGKIMVELHPCCQYGKVLIRAKKMADKRNLNKENANGECV